MTKQAATMFVLIVLLAAFSISVLEVHSTQNGWENMEPHGWWSRPSYNNEPKPVVESPQSIEAMLSLAAVLALVILLVTILIHKRKKSPT